MYAVIENTGGIDGWYASLKDAEDSRDLWDKDRPDHIHMVVKCAEADPQRSAIMGRWKWLADL